MYNMPRILKYHSCNSMLKIKVLYCTFELVVLGNLVNRQKISFWVNVPYDLKHKRTYTKTCNIHLLLSKPIPALRMTLVSFMMFFCWSFKDSFVFIHFSYALSLCISCS